MLISIIHHGQWIKKHCMVFTLLQARCNAVFLCVSCSVKSALALLTNTSATHEWRWLHVKGLEIERQ